MHNYSNDNVGMVTFPRWKQASNTQQMHHFIHNDDNGVNTVSSEAVWLFAAPSRGRQTTVCCSSSSTNASSPLYAHSHTISRMHTAFSIGQ